MGETIEITEIKLCAFSQACFSSARVEQLKGKIGGVNRLGSTSDLGLRLALRRLGIDLERDTKIITAGGNPKRFAGREARENANVLP